MDYALLKWDIDENDKIKFIDTLAPIVLFTYNRLEHTKKTVEALQKNIYSKDSQLIIYADGAKNPDAIESVSKVRKYLYSIDGFKSIEIIERKENWGLAKNIIDGVTAVVEKYGKIIVLEDDIITSKYFLKYMNDALEIYKLKDEVIQISGYLYPMQKDNLPDVFFMDRPDCWGWATWKNQWALFERDPDKLIKEFTKDDIYRFNCDGVVDFWSQVVDNYNGKLYTWAIFFQVASFKANKKTLYPKVSMTYNIGNDGSGENCGITKFFDTKIATQPITKYPLIIKTNILAEKFIRSYYKKNKKSTVHRLLLKFKKIVKILIKYK